MSGLRKVELVDSSGTEENRQNAYHVVGVDESGNHADAPFVMVAVQCPRSHGEKLAEWLIQLGLQPWKSKSSSTPEGMSNSTLSRQVGELIHKINDSDVVTWHGVAGWGNYNKDQRGATACIVASKTITNSFEDSSSECQFEGPAVLLHDGGKMYGKDQITLRRYASRQFGRGFNDRFVPVYVSNIQKGDKTYPEITAADYIAGLINAEITEKGLGEIDIDRVNRIDNSWRSSNETPAALYNLRTRDRSRQKTKEERVAAWIEGRRPPESDSWGEGPVESLLDRLDSDTVREYILNEL